MEKLFEIISFSEEKTLNFAKDFAKTLKSSCVISLVGDLGAGKTTFSKGFAIGIGVNDVITSPTFNIMIEYQGNKFKLYHFDLYRLSSLEEAIELGFEEYFYANDGIVLCEWASNAKGILPDKFYEVQIDYISQDKRKITIKGNI